MAKRPIQYSSTAPVMLAHAAETGFEAPALLIYCYLYLAVSPSVSFYDSVTITRYTC